MSDTRFKLSEVAAELRAEHDDIVIEGDNGEEFRILPPQLWPDEVLAAGDDLKAARALLGDKYAAFVKAGGSASLIRAVAQKAAGESVGESRAS